MPITYSGRDTGIRPYRWIGPFHSFNLAFANRAGEIGFPVNTICEVFGHKGIGKSAFCYSIAGRIAAYLAALSGSECHIVLADIERHLDTDYLTTMLEFADFNGQVHICRGDSDTEMLEDLTREFGTGHFDVGILDAVGAISPIAEDQGNLGDANMGRRAFLMSQFARRITKICRDSTPRVVFAANHVHQHLGSRGSSSSGGVVLRYLASTRIRLSIIETFDDGSCWLEGKVENNTFGFSGRKFRVINLAGYGLHPGLSAVKDCVLAGLAKESRTIKLGDRSFGYMKNLITNWKDDDLFRPFQDALKESTYTVSSTSEETEDE